MRAGMLRQRWPIAGALLGAGMAIAPFVAALVLPAAAAAILLGLLVFGIMRGRFSSLRPWITRWTLASFLLHLVVGAAVTYSVAGTYLGPDALDYHREATALADRPHGLPSDVALSQGKEGFPYSLAFLYRIFGPEMIAGIAMNSAFAAALVPLMTDTTARMFGIRSTRFVPVLVTLLPGFVVWPSQLLREAGVLVLLSLVLNAAARLSRRISLLPVVAFVVGATLLLTFRPSVGLVVVGSLMLALGFAARSVLTGVSIQVSAAVLLGLIVLGAGVGYAGFALTAGSRLEDVDAFRSGISEADSGFATETQLSSPADVARFLPIASLRFLLGPFPWEIGSVAQAPALVDVLPWWLLIPSLLSGIAVGWRRLGRGVLLFLIPAALTLVLLSLTAGNYGLLLRERTQFVLLLVPLIAVGAVARRTRVRVRRG